MKTRLIVLVVIFALLIGGGFAGHKALQLQTEAAVDAAFERRIAEADLLRAFKTAPRDAHDTQWLEALYAKPGERRTLNEGYAQLKVWWTLERARLEHDAWFPVTPIDDARLGAEIDERFGAGAFAQMTRQYELHRQDALAEARHQRDLEDLAEALAHQDGEAVSRFIAVYDRYPREGSRIVNGQVVEPN